MVKEVLTNLFNLLKGSTFFKEIKIYFDASGEKELSQLAKEIAEQENKDKHAP